MEIRHLPHASPLPPSPLRTGPRVPAEQAYLDPTTEEPGKGIGALTEYVTQGEWLGNGTTADYRDLIRAARQQQVQPTQQRDLPAPGVSTYANRALSAYQANSGMVPEGRRIDDFV